MKGRKVFYREKPKLLWIIVFSIPALAGVLGVISGLYTIIRGDEMALGIWMTILMGLAGLGFGSYVLSSLDPYRHRERYFLRLSPEAVEISKGKHILTIPKESVMKVKTDFVKVRPFLPPVKWTNIEYREAGQTRVERFPNLKYGGNDFAGMIKRRFKK